MKIILVHPNTETRLRLAEWLERDGGHTVLSFADFQDDWPALFALHEPDLVLLPELDAERYLRFLLGTFVPFPECQYRYLPKSPLFTGSGVSEALEAVMTDLEPIGRSKMTRP